MIVLSHLPAYQNAYSIYPVLTQQPIFFLWTKDQLKLDDNSTLSFKDKCIVEAQKLIVFTHGFVQGVGRDDENNQPLLEVAELMEDLAKSSQLEMTDVVVVSWERERMS